MIFSFNYQANPVTNKINAIKLIRDFTKVAFVGHPREEYPGASLMESKNFVDAVALQWTKESQKIADTKEIQACVITLLKHTHTSRRADLMINLENTFGAGFNRFDRIYHPYLYEKSL